MPRNQVLAVECIWTGDCRFSTATNVICRSWSRSSRDLFGAEGLCDSQKPKPHHVSEAPPAYLLVIRTRKKSSFQDESIVICWRTSTSFSIQEAGYRINSSTIAVRCRLRLSLILTYTGTRIWIASSVNSPYISTSCRLMGGKGRKRRRKSRPSRPNSRTSRTR
jgi:hypothetical protein